MEWAWQQDRGDRRMVLGTDAAAQKMQSGSSGECGICEASTLPERACAYHETVPATSPRCVRLYAFDECSTVHARSGGAAIRGVHGALGGGPQAGVLISLEVPP